VNIRLAEEGDDEALVAIDRVTWSPDTSPADAPSPGPFFNDTTTQVGNVWVAEIDDRVVGYGKMGHPTPLPSSEHVWHVNGLAVDPEFGGRGIGRALMQRLMEEARARGGARMTLRVFAPNERARRLYERLGFEVEGVLRGEFRQGDVDIDDVFMAIRLG
jgi:ribosomal protein S18 acetylase RimI-like enzyme